MEAQRQQLHEWNMKAEHERDEWRAKEDDYKNTVRELKAKGEAADLDKVKRLSAEVEELKRQLSQAREETAAALTRAASAPQHTAEGAPPAPPMAPPMSGVVPFAASMDGAPSVRGPRGWARKSGIPLRADPPVSVRLCVCE